MAENTGEINNVGRSPEQVYGRDAKSLLRAGKGEASGEERDFWNRKGVVAKKPQEEGRESLTPGASKVSPDDSFFIDHLPPSSVSMRRETQTTPIHKPNVLKRILSSLNW